MARSSGFLKSDTDRFCVVEESQLDHVFKYFTADDKKDLKGVINLMEVVAVRPHVSRTRTPQRYHHNLYAETDSLAVWNMTAGYGADFFCDRREGPHVRIR